MASPFTDIEEVPQDPPENDFLRSVRELQVGFGAKAFRMDPSGMWLGGKSFATAAFSVDMLGNVVARSATIAGYRLFEAVVGPSGADYTTVSAALAAGKKRIFVRNGTYTDETPWNLTVDNTFIVGESFGGVDIQFGYNTSYHVRYAAANLSLNNLRLTAYESVDNDLIRFDGASYARVEKCILKNRRSKIFNGAFATNTSIDIIDCRIDNASLNSGTTPNIYIFYGLSDARVINCSLNSAINYTGTGWTLFYNCGNVLVIGGKFKETGSNDMRLANNSGTVFCEGCLFECSNIISDAHHVGCYINNNTTSNSGYFIWLTPSTTTFIGNRCNCPVDMDMLYADSANTNVSNNYFEGGKNIFFSHTGLQIKGNIFSGNIWNSAYTLSPIVLTMDSTIYYMNCIGNTIRNNSNSFTPVITNGGTGNNVQFNQLIQG